MHEGRDTAGRCSATLGVSVLLSVGVAVALALSFAQSAEAAPQHTCATCMCPNGNMNCVTNVGETCTCSCDTNGDPQCDFGGGTGFCPLSQGGLSCGPDNCTTEQRCVAPDLPALSGWWAIVMPALLLAAGSLGIAVTYRRRTSG